MKTINKSVLTKLKDMGFAVQTLNNKYTFLHKGAEEGIIVDDTTVENFAYIYGERIAGEAASTVVADAMEILTRELCGAPSTEECKAVPDKQDIENTIDNVETALSVMQDNITIDAVTAHPGAIQVLLTLQTTPKEYIKQLKVVNAKNGKPAVYVPYVDGQYMTRALNFAFLFDWSFEVPETRQDGEYFTALGLLTVNLDGKTITKSQWGSQKMRKGMELGDALKGATTDALKKCASMFGIAADVYAGEV